MTEAVLCYIDRDTRIAYFTTRPLAEQWGDDWNDAPYECNAGDPYTFSDYDAKQGREPWEIVCVVFTVNDLYPPSYPHFNSPWNVDDINALNVPWLRTDKWSRSEAKPIWAGATIKEFKRLIRKAGGIIYKVDEDE